MLGLAMIAYGGRRREAVRNALARGEFADPDDRLLNALTALGVVLSVGVLVLVIVEP